MIRKKQTENNNLRHTLSARNQDFERIKEQLEEQATHNKSLQNENNTHCAEIQNLKLQSTENQDLRAAKYCLNRRIGQLQKQLKSLEEQTEKNNLQQTQQTVSALNEDIKHIQNLLELQIVNIEKLQKENAKLQKENQKIAEWK